MAIAVKRSRMAMLAAAAGASGLAAYAVAAALTSNVPSPPGITPEVQQDLQMTKPTHNQPTMWGEFLIVPLFEPSNATESLPPPAPDFGDDAVTTGSVAGVGADREVAAVVPRFVDLSPSAKKLMDSKGLALAGAEASMSPDGSFLSGLLYGRTEPTNAMLQLTAFTVMNPVQVTEFPRTAVYDFTASTAVAGHPTITKFPAKGTSDPNGDREIKWSQNRVAYFLKSFGPISDEELLGIANGISAMEAKR